MVLMDIKFTALNNPHNNFVIHCINLSKKPMEARKHLKGILSPQTNFLYVEGLSIDPTKNNFKKIKKFILAPKCQFICHSLMLVGNKNWSPGTKLRNIKVSPGTKVKNKSLSPEQT